MVAVLLGVEVGGVPVTVALGVKLSNMGDAATCVLPLSVAIRPPQTNKEKNIMVLYRLAGWVRI
jgi:hypothetical protein